VFTFYWEKIPEKLTVLNGQNLSYALTAENNKTSLKSFFHTKQIGYASCCAGRCKVICCQIRLWFKMH